MATIQGFSKIEKIQMLKSLLLKTIKIEIQMRSLPFQMLGLSSKSLVDHPAQTGQQVPRDQPALIVRRVQRDQQVQIDQPAQR